MASGGPGKYRERKGRASKPYDRPKGIIRRVTDSVTGLFSASWLTGWMGGEEEEEGGSSSSQEQLGPSSSSCSSHSQAPSTLPPPGESFIFAQPVTARRPFKPFYPEEGETESTAVQTASVNEGASTSRMNMPTASVPASNAAPTPPLQLTVESSSPAVSSRRLPVLSSTPNTIFAGRPKGQLEPRTLPLLATSAPTTGDDGSSEISESSADTGVDASVIPRPDERDYQREILQLDEESLQTLRDTLAKSVPAPPSTTTTAPPTATILPTLEETRKRPRDLEPDHSSIRAEGSVSSKSLFSEVGDLSHGQPQPSGLASKRPRFNVSMYGSPVLDDKSVLSDSSFKASPFYPGKTMYGGASAYRRSRYQSRTPLQTARTQVKAKSVDENSEDGGLSQAARRILESLEQMSTPISDAKRIPTPTAGQRGSFLDYLSGSHRVAAFHQHQRRTSLRQATPPTAPLLTPTKVAVQANLATSLLATATTTSSSQPLPDKNNTSTTLDNNKKPQVPATSGGEQEETQHGEEVMGDDGGAPISIFSKAMADPTGGGVEAVASSLLLPTPTLDSSVFRFGLASTDSTSHQPPQIPFVPKPAIAIPASDAASKKFGGKVKSKVVESGRSSVRVCGDEEGVEDPKLPAVTLTMSSLPKINLSLSVPVHSSPVKSSSSSSLQGFKFSIPEIVDTESVGESLASAPKFTFRSPAVVGEAASQSPPHAVMFNSSTPSLTPKLRVNVNKVAPKLPDKVVEGGSVLDILKPKGNNSPEMFSSSLSNHQDALRMVPSKPFSASPSIGTCNKSVCEQSVNNLVKETDTSQGFQSFGSAFRKSSNEWDCSVCMVRNKNLVDKCVACETAKPGQNTSSNSNSSSNSTIKLGDDKVSAPVYVSAGGVGWGDAFKKSSSEWECDTCMVHNKDYSEKCVACQTPKPRSKNSSSKKDDTRVVSGGGLGGGGVSEAGSREDKGGFGEVFAKKKGEWECDTCFVRNKSEATKCVSCETPKPGAANVSEAMTGNFRFGVNTNTSSSTFKFGLTSNSQTDVIKMGGAAAGGGSSGFSFGASVKNGSSGCEEKGVQQQGFKFGVPMSDKKSEDALTDSVFGSSSSESVQSSKENNGESNNSSSTGFTFGVPATSDLNKTSREKTNKESSSSSAGAVGSVFSCKKTLEGSGVAATTTTTPTAPLFQFTSTASETKVAFSFGSGAQGTITTDKPSKAAAVPNEVVSSAATQFKDQSGDVAVIKEKESEAKLQPTFGSKMDNADGNVKPLGIFGFNSIAPAAASASKKKDTKFSDPFRFNANKTPDSTSEVSSPSTFKAKTNTDIAAAPSTGTFIFGDKGSTNSFPPFSFSTPSINKDEPKPNFTFNVNSKRDSAESLEPAKKVAMFGSGSTTGGINNGLASAPTLFTFGSKENKLGTGTGFGAPPTTTPAFGAPAPSSNTTASFQFGNSNPPAPAATAPSPAFGNPAPTFGGAAATSAFGSNTTTSSATAAASGFAFGQSSEKKSSAGFDFGQAATNTTSASQGFNFAAAIQPSSGIFQFGQNQVNSGTSSSIFQFGSAGTEVPAPATATAFGSGDNPFSTAPPSGRVVKKAVRRNRK